MFRDIVQEEGIDQYNFDKKEFDTIDDKSINDIKALFPWMK